MTERRARRRRERFRATFPNGFRKRLSKLGYAIRWRPLPGLFASGCVWLIEGKSERSEAKSEGSRVWFEQADWESRVEELKRV
jgi:hypothetical protein